MCMSVCPVEVLVHVIGGRMHGEEEATVADRTQDAEMDCEFSIITPKYFIVCKIRMRV